MSSSRVWAMSRYGQLVIQLPAGWPPLFSFEWWSGIGTGLLSATAALVIGGTTIAVAIRSHLLAQRVAKNAEALAARDRAAAAERASRERDDRYRASLGRVVDTAITSVVEYGNVVKESWGKTPEEMRWHAAAQARLLLVHATADERDSTATSAILEEFLRIREQLRWDVRRNSAGLLASALANVLARHNTPEEIAAAARGFIDKETAAAKERTRAAQMNGTHED